METAKRRQRWLAVASACTLLLLLTPRIKADATSHSVKKGKVKVGQITYPVFKKVALVHEAFGGISYTINAKSPAKARSLAARLRKFYSQKKINGQKPGKFKPSAKPETTGWVAQSCLKKKKAMVGIKVTGKEVTVYVLADCIELEAMAF